jgi:hypothetical protein
MPILNREKTMTINWNNITVTDNTPELPDFDLEFDLQDGWETSTQVLDPKPLKYEETEGEDDDIILDDSGEFVYNGDDEDDEWIDPTDADLTQIETSEISCIN